MSGNAVLTRTLSVDSTGSHIQLTPRLLIVPPFTDHDKVDRYRNQVSKSISVSSTTNTSIEEIDLGDKADEQLLEEPRPNKTTRPPIKEIVSNRAALGKFLTENLYFQLFVVILIFVDAIIVIIVDLKVASHNECSSDAKCPKGEAILDHGHIVDCFINRNKTKCGYHDGHRTCLLADAHEDANTLKVLHYVGFGVLSVFLLEVLLRIFALGKSFFTKKMEMLDGLLVLVAFVIYAIIEEPFHAAAQAAAFLVLLRVIRMKRIVNGITTDTHKRNIGKRKLLQEQLKVYGERDRTLCAELVTLKEEVRRFRYIAEKAEDLETCRVESSM